MPGDEASDRRAERHDGAGWQPGFGVFSVRVSDSSKLHVTSPSGLRASTLPPPW